MADATVSPERLHAAGDIFSQVVWHPKRKKIMINSHRMHLPETVEHIFCSTPPTKKEEDNDKQSQNAFA